MVEQGFEIFVETPQYFTIRARTPKQGFVFNGIDMSHKTFDFALCRTEEEYSDGRRPDLVRVGTIRSDLSRRDFTMNAIALSEDGVIIDPYEGVPDIHRGMIRCVGGVERLEEDSLRMLRALRFAIQLDFSLSSEIVSFLQKGKNALLLENVSEERIQEELKKMMKIDTWNTLGLLQDFPDITFQIFSGDIWLMPTVKGTGNEKTKHPDRGSICAYSWPRS